MSRPGSIDLNADMGEGFGPYRIGDDLALLDIVSSANVACGFHAGDPNVMHTTFKAARDRGVAIGAHPGFADRAHFGRRILPMSADEIERMVAYQIGAACGMAALAGHRITYVKAHGALYNLAAVELAAARAIARAIRAVDPRLVCLTQAGTEGERAAIAEGLVVAAEIFADRAYLPNGTLVERGKPGAVLHNPAQIASRVIAMLESSCIVAEDGTRFATRMDSLCVHGDTPDAVNIAKTLKVALVAAGYQIRSFTSARP